jgi:hypothetical protein
MTLIDGGEIMRKSRDMLRIGKADSEVSIQTKTKMNYKDEEITSKDVTWS